MNATHIDHVTVTAPTLAAGIDYVRQALGVAPQAGGEHARMGTHNCLPRPGAALFLEVIAVNPDAAPVRAILVGIGCEGPLLVTPLGAGVAPYLVGHIHTPAGARRLGGAA